MYKYFKKLRKNLEYKKIIKERLISWRKEPVIIRIEKPTKLDRAHSLGYKAKQGFVLARIRIGKGSSKREKPSGGRKPKHAGLTKMTPKMNLQHIAEIRVAKRFPNLEVLNSYYIAEDGKHKWFEVILIDPNHSCIKNDPKLNWICKPAHRKRVFRGLTSAGKKSRVKS
ncbi:MAG: 50S ribosomal protein L15e [Candidatus Aenigmarchaeota archaeon]|nr:50S ribosomal protein L15e [Candidatus Aenigmarchaeota archaeon]